jgi:protein AFG1
LKLISIFDIKININFLVYFSAKSESKTSDNRIINIYKSKVNLKLLSEDNYQLEVIKQLQKLDNELKTYSPIKLSFFDKLLKRDSPVKSVKGLYLYGTVGCGKTMLMDLFHDNCRVDNKHKRRVHFHSFMLDFHNSLFLFQNYFCFYF